MAKQTDISVKFIRYAELQLYRSLPVPEQQWLKQAAFTFRLTFQEFKQLVDEETDLQLWGEPPLSDHVSDISGFNSKPAFLKAVHEYCHRLRNEQHRYSAEPFTRPKKREKSKIINRQSDKKIWGMCPVASEKTVCCNLRTIDAVENCVYGCSYCTIQTFYNEKIVFDENFVDKLKNIELDPQRHYHFGTGQSSDSLAWGNRFGNLAALCDFAASNPNVLMEFKTKSDNVAWFLENKVPSNIVCSWSLNTDTIVDNEEHFTASLEQRIQAARTVADNGIKVAFHFHPMVNYAGWEEDYPAIAQRLLSEFDSDEVLFISLGSVTLIKPVIQKIRKLGFQTRTTQFPFAPDPHGKLTYPDELKITMFQTQYNAFADWHDKVFFYLCMEKAAIWHKTLGYAYPDNETFERVFSEHVRAKTGKSEEMLSP